MFCPTDPLLLFASLGVQMPHFFALSWMYREDYKRGDFVMVSSNDPDGSRTSSLITRYTWYLSALPFLSSMAGTTNWMFAVEGVVLNGAFLYYGRKVRGAMEAC